MTKKIPMHLCCLSKILYFLLFLLALSASSQTAPPGAPNPGSSQPATADFLGAVADAGGKPLEGVHVTLTIYGPEHQPVAIYGSMSNEKGRFSIPEVPAGTYDLELEKRGYLMVPSEKSGPVSGKRVRLKAGERFPDVALRMALRAIIAGRLFDESGVPMPGVVVAAKSAGSIEEKWQTAQTNDRGEFRLSVQPGKYLIGADASSHAHATLLHPGGKADYQLTYFPGVATPDEASLVEALPGGTTGDIDFKAMKASTYTVKAEVTGIPEHEGHVSIDWMASDRYGESTGSGGQSTTVEAKNGGTASLTLGPWASGTYRLIARYRTEGQELQSLPVDVTIAAADVQGVLLPLAAELELDGMIAVQGEKTQTGQVARTVRLVPQDQKSFSLMRMAESGPDGSFRLTGIAPSRYFVAIEPLPENGFIESVELNGSPVKDQKPDLSGVSSAARLKIVISLNGARISGRLDQPGKSGQSQVILLPRGPTISPGNFHTITPGDDGSYSIDGIAPGEYALVAFRLSIDTRKLSELLQRNQQAIVMLEVRAGDKIVKDLKVITEAADAPQK